MVDKLKKLAVLRGDGVGRPCPFGLSVSISCKSVGDAIHDMVALKQVPEQEQDRQKQVNRRIYRHSNEGQPCPYLEGAVKHAKYDTVNCDAEDANPGVHESPWRPSPYYPRIGAGFNINVLNGYGFSNYNDTGPDSYMSNFHRPAMVERDGFYLIAGEYWEGKQPFEEKLEEMNDQGRGRFDLSGLEVLIRPNAWAMYTWDVLVPANWKQIKPYIPHDIWGQSLGYGTDSWQFYGLPAADTQILLDILEKNAKAILEDIQMSKDSHPPLKSKAALEAPATIPQLEELGPPTEEWYEAHVSDGQRVIEKSGRLQSLDSAKAWTENRVGPGVKVEIEGRMIWLPPGAEAFGGVSGKEYVMFDFENLAHLKAAAVAAPQLVVPTKEPRMWRARGLEMFVRLQSVDGQSFTEQYRKFEEKNPQLFGEYYDRATGKSWLVFTGEDDPKTLEFKTASLKPRQSSQTMLPFNPSDPLSHPMLQVLGQPYTEVYDGDIWDAKHTAMEERFESNSFQTILEWVADHKGPGKIAAIGGWLEWRPSEKTRELLEKLRVEGSLTDESLAAKLMAASQAEPGLVTKNEIGGGWSHPTYVIRDLRLDFLISESEFGDRKADLATLHEIRPSFVFTEDGQTWTISGLAPEKFDLLTNAAPTNESGNKDG